VTSTRPSSRHRGDEPPGPAGHWLVEVAELLETLGDLQGWRPILAGAVDLEPPVRRRRLEVVDLDDTDPVAGLLGVVAPGRVRAVGFVAGCRARLLDHDVPPVRGGFVHVVDREGLSVTHTVDADGCPYAVGPTRAVQVGRVPDACRRALGLATAPPPPDTVALVVDAWLDRVVRAARHRTDLTWADVVALHPSDAVPCTPAELAHRTVQVGDELSWSAVRQAYADGRVRHDGSTDEGTGTGIDAATAAWMDDGMFARWLTGAAMPWSSLLEIIDALLAPHVSDLVAAAVGMCPPPCWPEP
jgi:hypothetical protein